MEWYKLRCKKCGKEINEHNKLVDKGKDGVACQNCWKNVNSEVV